MSHYNSNNSYPLPTPFFSSPWPVTRRHFPTGSSNSSSSHQQTIQVRKCQMCTQLCRYEDLDERCPTSVCQHPNATCKRCVAYIIHTRTDANGARIGNIACPVCNAKFAPSEITRGLRDEEELDALRLPKLKPTDAVVLMPPMIQSQGLAFGALNRMRELYDEVTSHMPEMQFYLNHATREVPQSRLQYNFLAEDREQDGSDRFIELALPLDHTSRQAGPQVQQTEWIHPYDLDHPEQVAHERMSSARSSSRHANAGSSRRSNGTSSRYSDAGSSRSSRYFDAYSRHSNVSSSRHSNSASSRYSSTLYGARTERTERSSKTALSTRARGGEVSRPPDSWQEFKIILAIVLVFWACVMFFCR